MIELSPKTAAHIHKLFAESDQPIAAGLLRDRCADDLPLMRNATPNSLERIRFAALKCSGGNLDKLRQAVELARLDWRDLLMAAGFGHDTAAHPSWTP